MSPKEEHDAAVRALRRAAASQLARKEAHEAAVAKLEAEGARWRAEREAWPELAADIDAALAELEGRLERARSEAEGSAADLRASLDALEEAQGQRGELERATLLREVRAAASSDPFAPTAAEAALANVRSAAGELEAEAKLGEELAPEPRAEAQSDPEARARAELARLKAARREKASGESEAPEPMPKPKRSM